MRVLITGSNGYIGSNLIPVLGLAGHHIIALVRDPERLKVPKHLEKQLTVVVGDLVDKESLGSIPEDVDVAYYLVHSMTLKSKGFLEEEGLCALNFRETMEKTACKQIIYLGGLAGDGKLSEHLTSRLQVEEILNKGTIPTTIFRASIIIGSGSASFEIIRDLVEKLPIMVVPKWVDNLCSPIAISDVIFYLKTALGSKECYNKVFEIGGPESLSYRQMISKFAKARGLHRFIIPLPCLTPYLSSFWLFFITSTSFPLAQALVDSLQSSSIVLDELTKKIIPHDCARYDDAMQRTFMKMEQQVVVSCWNEAVEQIRFNPNFKEYIQVPHYGTLKHVIKMPYTDKDTAQKKLWKIGGNNGWYAADWAWKIRGFIDKMVGGKGLHKGRRDPIDLQNGDLLDFWRVLLADKEGGRLVLYSEMRLPGEAWLEFRLDGESAQGSVTEIVTFRPKGLLGRFYWYLLFPIHYFVFRGVCKGVAQG